MQGESQKGRLFIEIEPDPITGVGVISGPSDWHRGGQGVKGGQTIESHGLSGKDAVKSYANGLSQNQKGKNCMRPFI